MVRWGGVEGSRGRGWLAGDRRRRGGLLGHRRGFRRHLGDAQIRPVHRAGHGEIDHNRENQYRDGEARRHPGPERVAWPAVPGKRSGSFFGSDPGWASLVFASNPGFSRAANSRELGLRWAGGLRHQLLEAENTCLSGPIIRCVLGRRGWRGGLSCGDHLRSLNHCRLIGRRDRRWPRRQCRVLQYRRPVAGVVQLQRGYGRDRLRIRGDGRHRLAGVLHVVRRGTSRRVARRGAPRGGG